MNLDFRKICRLCLRCCDDYIDLHQNNGAKNLSTEIMKIINFCYGIQLDLAESLPDKICLQCVQVLTLFNTAKNNVVASEQLLKNILCIRNQKYESNKFPPFPKSEAYQSYGLEVVQVDKTSNSSDGLKPDKTINETVHNEIDMKPPNDCVNRFHKNLHVNKNTKNLAFFHDAKSNGDTNILALNKKSNMKSVKKVNDKSKKNRKKKSNRKQQNLEFLMKHRGINKLNLISSIRKIPPSLNKGQKKKEKCKEKVTDIVKVIGTVIDKNNILSPGVKRLKKETNTNLQATNSNAKD